MSDTQSPSTTAEHPPEEVRLAITGMTCASCSARIERKLAKVAGVQSATVNLATEKAQVRFTAPVTVDAIVAEVQKTGYGATVLDDTPRAGASSPASTTPGTTPDASPDATPRHDAPTRPARRPLAPESCCASCARGTPARTPAPATGHTPLPTTPTTSSTRLPRTCSSRASSSPSR